MISCRDWWPWNKPGYITVNRKQSNNQWGGGLAAHPASKNSKRKNPLEKFSTQFFWDQEGILLIDYLPKGQTINAEYYSYLLVQLKNIWRRNAARRSPKGLVLARQCPGSPGTCNPEETGLPGLPFSLSPTLFSGSGPVELPPVPWTQKTIERSPFSVRRKGHCCRGDLVGRTILWIFLSGLRKLEQRSKKSIELGEYVE